MPLRSPFTGDATPIEPLHQKLLKNVPKFGSKVALQDAETNKTWTFHQVKADSISMAHRLFRMGLQKGDVMSIYLENRPEIGIVIVALSAVGGVSSGINPLNTEDELNNQLTDSGAKYIVTRASLLDKLLAVPASKQLSHIILYDERIPSAYAKDPRFITLHSLLTPTTSGNNQEENETDSDGDDDIVHSDFPHVSLDVYNDLCILPFSSGTTGRPKGVMITHANINVAYFYDQYFDTNSSPWPVFAGEAILAILPFFHIAGFQGLCWGLYFGSRTIVMSSFEPKLYLECISAHKIEFLLVVPSILVFLAKHPMVAEYDLSSVKRVGVGAAPIGRETIQTLIKRFPKLEAVNQGYGMTESGGLITLTPNYPLDRYPIGSCGVPVPGVEVKVVDLKDNSKILGPMERGEIWARGFNTMKGYIGRPEATRETIDSQGWLHTGDIGYYDHSCAFYVVDRLKELIKYKGFQVPPAELEDVILTHPGVQEVGVTGICASNADIGELPTAFVLLKEGYPENAKTAQEIKNLVCKHLSHYKRLRGGVIFVRSLPKGGSGKLLRRALKDIKPLAKL